MKKIKKISIIIAVLGVLAFIVAQLKKLKDVTIKFKKILINKVSLKEIDVTPIFTVTNKSLIPITIQKQFYEIYVNGKFIETVEINNLLTLEAKGSIELPMHVNLDKKDLLKIALSFFGSKGLTLDLKGKISIGKGTKTISLPIKYSKKIM